MILLLLVIIFLFLGFFLRKINGGKSVTKYRSGTSPTSLIVSFSKFIKNRYKSI